MCVWRLPVNIDVLSSAPLKFNTPCLVVPVWQGQKLDGVAARLNKSLNGLVDEVMAQDGFKATVGETRVLYTNTNDAIAAPRVLLVGLGRVEKISLASLRKAASKAARGVRAIKRDSFALVVPLLDDLAERDAATALTEGIILGLHVFHDFKTDEEVKAQTQIGSVTFLTDKDLLDAVQPGVRYGQLAAEANLRGRYLVNLPSNMKWPDFMAQQAQQIADESGLRCEVWDENRILEERMGALLGVGMGSDKPPRFMVLEYAPEGKENEQPIILVGKGMTFDSGGYSLKPSTGMEDMKDDMGGAAVVLGAMSVLKDMDIPHRVLGIIASAENMVSGRAQRPGDIVTARNGKTIEVINTDAEGRLILADALSYASEQNPRAIIDFATLTGAMTISLGQEAAGLFSNNSDLARQVWQAGETSGDRVWEFPMWDEYREHIKGTVSDIKNMGIERRAGSIAAAVFLEHFVGPDIPWAHLDIASVAFVRDDRPLVARGATGFGVRLTLELLRNW
jgi:leucyl aminopeptidase